MSIIITTTINLEDIYSKQIAEKFKDDRELVAATTVHPLRSMHPLFS
jgi:hypothetical protein